MNETNYSNTAIVHTVL